ncbi:hsp90 co-chaperone Cdc37-like 1 isoform X1 [Entelurus aequoreus]|uniref:hsp90 co-chaperone Cdc37-like 1 isoform X1 n=1 Tax=Entelurus aequoreus TaxID=161455 RepID=UPI002B1E6FC4|nr:hsp90 co-chaperone Cdc37-like 1 isoform X1 [Entelurus aequoreus]
MEWRSNNADGEPPWPATGGGSVGPTPQTSPCACATPSVCQSPQCCVKTPIVSSWTLAEVQDRLCSLSVHCSESLEQERARTRACPAELINTEEEWRRKESMLGGGPQPGRGPVLEAVGSWDVFDKSIINVQNQPAEADGCGTSLQKDEEELRHFGMLRRWDDSQRFLAEKPQLICEETANYLFSWCIRLQQEGKEALMAQVAHQAVAMQFILEMASNYGQDPRGCFRQFFQKAKEGQDVYLEVFHAELEALKRRVRQHVDRCDRDTCNEPSNGTNCRHAPKEAQQVAHYPNRRRGPLIGSGRWSKDDAAESEDTRMMETS